MKKLLTFLLTLIVCAGFAQSKVMVMQIKSEIDPRVRRYVDVALQHASNTKADVVIIEMDTYGGYLTDAKEIVDRISQFEKPVWVFINTDAASAGSMISIACDSIYMAPGASIGAATAVNERGERALDKIQSYTRSIMRSIAEKNGRDPQIAEGMVDERGEIKGIKKEGQVITFSTTEAIKHGFCEGEVKSIDELLRKNNLEKATVEYYSLNGFEKVMSFLLSPLVVNPFVSGFLILLIICGIWLELQSPGIGFGGLLAAVALTLYLIPYYLNGYADNWEIFALVVGFILICLEVFVIPGFGIVGVVGITLTNLALVLIMINNNFFDFESVPTNDLLFAVAATIGGLLGGIGILIFGGARLAQSRAFSRIALTDTQESKAGYTVNVYKEQMIGKQGIAHTVLRPSGRVVIDHQVFDAYTRGEYVEKGVAIEVVGQEGTTLQVRSIALASN